MKKIGITGNIGSGKTTVCRIFSVTGVPVFHADEMAKTIYDRDDFKDILLDRFGDKIFDKGNEVNKKKLAGIAFGDSDALAFLNSHIHPYVRGLFEDWINRPTVGRYVLYEAAILFESGHAGKMDGIIMVTAPEHMRIGRIMKRDGLTEEEVRLRMKNQWDEEIKAGKADWLIQNDGEHFLIPQVIKINEEINKNQTI